MHSLPAAIFSPFFLLPCFFFFLETHHERMGSSSQPTTELEPWEEPLKHIGFRMERMDSLCVQGRFIVSDRSCQIHIEKLNDMYTHGPFIILQKIKSKTAPFGVLHGGVSALIAEALASAGAITASGYGRAAGVQLTINHLKAAPIGTEVFASAKPIHVGKRLHVWDVTFVNVDKSSSKSLQDASDDAVVIAVSRVTLMVNLSTEVLDIKYQNQNIKSKL